MTFCTHFKIEDASSKLLSSLSVELTWTVFVFSYWKILYLNAAFACSLFTFFLTVKKNKGECLYLAVCLPIHLLIFFNYFLIKLQLFFLEMFHDHCYIMVHTYLSNIQDFSFIQYSIFALILCIILYQFNFPPAICLLLTFPISPL